MNEKKCSCIDRKECCGCGTTENIEIMEDPYASEVHDDWTLHYLCDSCAHDSAMEI